MVHEGEEQKWSNKQMCTKKVVSKSQKVPQRGPGVAELEKILREQNHKEEDRFSSSSSVFPLPRNSNFHPHSSSSSLIYPTLSSRSPPPPPPPPQQTARPPRNSVSPANSLPKPPHLAQKLEFIHGGGGGYPAMGYPKTTGSFLPTMWRSCDSISNGEVPKTDLKSSNLVELTDDEPDLIRPSTNHMLQRNCLNYSQSSMMNHYPSSALPASSVSSAGLNHNFERPSNQRPHQNYSSMWPEEEKMVGMKRACPFPDYPPPPSLSMQCKVPPFPPHLNRPEQATTSSHHQLTSNIETKNNTISREAKRRCQYEVSSNKRINRNDTIDGNILTLGPPMTPLPPSSLSLKDEFSDFQLSLHNGSIEDRCQRSRQGGKPNIEKPFYSFLQPNVDLSHEATTLSLDIGRDGGTQSLDLNLKL